MLNAQRKLNRSESSARLSVYLFILISSIFSANQIFAQDNSPYSRYGLGDLHPNTNIFNRGMAGISAGYSDPMSINFLNPASYSRFQTFQEAHSKKVAQGRMLLDVGLNFNNRTLRETSNPQSFTSSNGYFSYLQLGMPIKKDWGIVFGLRPLSTISYKIDTRERLYDPLTNQPIDSASTQFIGDGGSYMANIGTGFAIKNFSFGVNAGYLFGKKDYSTRRNLINDSVLYSASNHQTKTSFGGLFFNAGMQYRIDLKKDKSRYIQFGVYGNMKQKINTSSDIIRETYYIGSDGGSLSLDSVYKQSEIKGKMDYPMTYGAGFLTERLPDATRGGWLLGIDYIYNGWDDYRYNGQTDAVRSNWQLRVGGQIKPSMKEVKYKNFMAYRAGFFVGDDYVYIGEKLSTWGITAGVSLPIANLKDASRRFRTQYSIINLSAEYIKRGNNDSPIKENQFRVSVGFTLSDLWFTKRKYD